MTEASDRHQSSMVFSVETLEEFCKTVYLKLGLSDGDADLVANSLVQASHRIQQILSFRKIALRAFTGTS